jgi:hypothetical protein
MTDTGATTTTPRTSSDVPVTPAAVPARQRLLWAAVLAAPLAWVTDFNVRYLLIRTVNATDRVFLLHLVTALTFTTTLAAGVTCWLLRHRRPTASSEPGRDPERTPHRLALWGLALALFFGLLILAEAFPTLILGPRDLT